MSLPPQLPVAPPADSRARATYDALLDAAERLLAGGGYPAATTTAVAEAAGVSVGTVYGHVRDRDDLLAHLFAARLDGLLADVAAILTTDALLDDGLQALLGRAVDAVTGTYRRHAATFRAALVQLPTSPAIRATYRDRHDRARGVVGAFLRRAQAAGAVRAGDTDELADTLLVAIQALNHPLVTGAPRAARARAVRDGFVQMLLALLCQPDGVPSPPTDD